MAARKSSLKDEDRCGQCTKHVGEKDNGIQCELCESWFHTACEGVSDEMYKLVGKNEALHWFCKKCNSNAMKMLKEIGERAKEVDSRIAKLEKDMKVMSGHITKVKDEMMKDMQKLSTEVNEAKSEVDKQLVRNSKEMTELSGKFKEVCEGQESTWNEVVKKEVKLSLNTVSDDIQAVQNTLIETKIQANEQCDKESRRKNIIIYKIPESNKDRQEDRHKEDISFCMQLFNNALQAGVVEEDVVKVFRLGRRAERGASRPLMVQFGSYSPKNIIMESLYKLRGAEQKFSSVAIAHDMTLNEREQCKQLVAEAKELTTSETSGEYIYRVRGLPGQMKITKIRVRS